MGDSIKPELMTPSEAVLDQTKPDDTAEPMDDEKAIPSPIVSNRAMRRQASMAPAADASPPVAQAPVEPTAIEPAPSPAPPPEPEQAKPSAEAVYRVAPGRSMNSARGMLDADAIVTIADFCDQARMDELVVAGALVRS